MTRLVSLSTAVALAAFMMFPPAFAVDPLAFLHGEKRIVLLFAKSRSDAGLDKQLELLRERRPGLRERDMLVLVSEGRQDTIAAIGYTALPQGTARALRARFQPSPKGLTVILLGKDGTEQGRWNRPVEPEILFDLVDTMSMSLPLSGVPDLSDPEKRGDAALPLN